MSLTTESFVLFLHIGLVIVGLCLAAVMHAALLFLRAADEVSLLKPWPRVIAVLELLLPLMALLMLGTGAWLLYLSDKEFGWADGWVIASLVGLVVVEGAGASLGPRSAALRSAILAAPAGPVGPEVRRRVLDPALWCVMHGGTSVFLGIVFLMVVKPSGAWSAAVLATAAALGAASGLPFTRRAAEPATVPGQRKPEVSAEPEKRWTRPRS